MLSRRAFFWATGLAALVWPVPGRRGGLSAQGGSGEVKVVARAYGAIPDPKALSVTFDRANDLNLWIRSTLKTRLSYLGWQVGGNAVHVLTFRSELRDNNQVSNAFTFRADRNRGRENTFALDLTLPLGGASGFGPSSRFAITASLAGENGGTIWQGTASTITRYRSLIEVQNEVVAALAAAVGETVGSGVDY